nr:Fc receptor-like protein 4 isoform X1 [Microcebus murinus]XP_012604171.1 Fc receptor-like protein 4 isoform X1 [Microcebus murinus]XP_012604172.1 Fc receptor-like protein 4 isoform X1 [Microcebus murinus]XP_012604173.1 Fc receptor-like protein 4 isoform X1 [Microcebus murinus]
MPDAPVYPRQTTLAGTADTPTSHLFLLFSSATAPKPVISLHPPWTTVFRGERVNLTCNGFHYSPQKTKWYSWKKIVTDTPGNTLEVRASGEYTCQTGGSTPSNPVHLFFSIESLILQAPYSVFEGDTLVLRCQRKGKKKLTAVKYFWNRKILSTFNESRDLLIPQASSNNNGDYQCTGTEDKNYVFRSNRKMIKIQELFPRPKLIATVSQPTEGNSVNLSCETQLPPERSDTPLYFVFFGDDGVVLSNWSKSPELQIPAVWREDSGSYWCGAETASGSVHKRSLPLQIHVQRIPVSGVLMETQPPGDQVAEGEVLVLVCSVAEGTGDTTFSWHREDTNETLGRKTLRSQRAELEIPVIRESHAGGYYCAADNSYGPVQSGVVNVTVRGTPGSRGGVIAVGATGGLLGTLLLAVALLFSCWHRRKSETSLGPSLNPPSHALSALLSTGDGFRGNETRSPPTAGPAESPQFTCPVQVELQSLYGNVHLEEGDLVYSEVQTIHLGEEGEGTSLGRNSGSKLYSFLQQILTESLLCARYCCKYGKSISKQGRQKSLQHGAWILKREDRLYPLNGRTATNFLRFIEHIL